MTARAAPPAPRMTAGPGMASQPGAPSSRLARKPTPSVDVATSRLPSRQTVLTAPIAWPAGFDLVHRRERRLLVRAR